MMKNRLTEHVYAFGAVNRMMWAADGMGNMAEYDYNGLGHRVGMRRGSRTEPALKEPGLEGILPEEPEIWSKETEYILDLTKGYHNLLQKEENGSIQSYIWDREALFVEEEGESYSCLNDLQGSVMRLLSHNGQTKESYSYDEFGADLFGNQGQFQPFGYTGYQKDDITGTYYAQAREYDAGAGRFTSEDVIKGHGAYPETLNAYGYCWGNSLKYVDRDGKSPILVIGIAGILGVAIDLGFQTYSNVKQGENWYDYDWNEACIAGTASMLSTVVFMAAPQIATAIVGAGASAGTVAGVTIGVVAVGNFAVGASMSLLSDYNNDVDRNKMLKNAIISGTASSIFSVLTLGWNVYNHDFKSYESTIGYDLLGMKYNKYGLEDFYKNCLKEDLTKFLILVYGYDIGSAIAQTVLEDIINEEEECPDS